MDSGCGNSPSERRLRFGRSRRLLKRPDFVEVYQTGKKAYGRYAVVFCRRRTGEARLETWRLGITATRKTGKAVRRNRQKRLIREYFRLNQDWIPPGWDFVVNTKASLNEASCNELKADLDRTMDRLGFSARAKSSSS